MNIKTVSKLTERSAITYFRAGLFFFNPIATLVIYVAVSLALLTMVLVGDIAASDYKDTLIYTVMIAIVTFLLLYLYFVLPGARWKKIKDSPKGETHLTFGENSVHIATFVGGERRKEGNVAYTSFVRFKETKNYVFIYVARNQALIVDKSKLSGGTAEELRKKLKSFKSVSYRYIAL